MSNKIKAVICEPQKPPRVEFIAQDLETLQDTVGGCIEIIHPFRDDACIILNDEGKIIGLPLNRPLKDAGGAVYDVITGTFIIAGDTGAEDFTSLSDEQAAHYLKEFAEPITEETAEIYKPLAEPRIYFEPVPHFGY